MTDILFLATLYLLLSSFVGGLSAGQFAAGLWLRS